MNAFPNVRLRLTLRCLFIHLSGALLAGWVCYEIIFYCSANLMYLLGGFMACLLFCYCLGSLFLKDIWVVEADKLKIKSVIGNVKKEIPLSAITSWLETPVSAWYGGGFVLTLYTTQGNLELVTRWYSNYYPIRAILCRDTTRHAVG